MDNISSRLLNDEPPNDLSGELNYKAEPKKIFTYKFKVSDIVVQNKTHFSSEFNYKDFRWWIYVEWNSSTKHLAGYLCCDGPFADWTIKADFDLKLVTQTPGTTDQCFKFTNCEFDEGRLPFTKEKFFE